MAKKNDKVEKAESAEATPEVAETIPSLEEELAKQKDLLLRTAAEFDNYKKRTERERIMTAEYTKANILKAFLPVFDNVDRAEECDPQSAEYAKGVEMIVKQLKEVVNTLGIAEIGAVGDKFDPNLHEAVMHEENEEAEENTITQVFQKGYRIGDTVIRAAMVKVAN
ncbi:MAG: nucleotide exchange factor GrpE [Acutalibacteraceae bacterium]|nr:nucleotide exchange factor GrpE [Acutalibacteraceae bacterium]